MCYGFQLPCKRCAMGCKETNSNGTKGSLDLIHASLLFKHDVSPPLCNTVQVVSTSKNKTLCNHGRYRYFKVQTQCFVTM